MIEKYIRYNDTDTTKNPVITKVIEIPYRKAIKTMLN
jgi:hypothetical protein